MNTSDAQISSISPAEVEILKILWDEAPLTADAIISRLGTNQSTHPRTVKTLLNRLVKKNAISFSEEGRRYHYFPVLDRESFYKQETHSFLERLFDGQLSPLISHFAKRNRLTDKDLDELESLIKKIKEQNNE